MNIGNDIDNGVFTESVNINKAVTILTKKSAAVKALNYGTAFNVKSNNVAVDGFKIIESQNGINANGYSNCIIENNLFNKVGTSIILKNTKNIIIYNNEIIPKDKYTTNNNIVYNPIGIIIENSKNLTIQNNKIDFTSSVTSNGQTMTGIRFDDSNSQGAIFANNFIGYLNRGTGISAYGELNIENNTIQNYATGIYSNLLNSNINQNNITKNNIGLRINSQNTNYYSNNIVNNKIYGIEDLGSKNTKISVNRIYNNNFDFYSVSNNGENIDINNNWWGVNTPTISNNDDNPANIYSKYQKYSLQSWIVMNLEINSYKIDDSGNIEKVKCYLIMEYNNHYQRVSNINYLYDNIEFGVGSINYNNKFLKTNTSFLKNGIGYVGFDFKDSFKDSDNILITVFLDNQTISKTLNKKAKIDLSLVSTAINKNTNNVANYTKSIDFTQNINWVTYSWSETGLYEGVINVIINGNIVDSINVVNNNYLMYKNQYGSNVFKAIKFYNNVFASMKEGVWEPNGLYSNFVESFKLNGSDYNLVQNEFFKWLKNNYSLSDVELNFVKNNYGKFIDVIIMAVDFHGDKSPNFKFKYNDIEKGFHPPSSYAKRISNLYYTNIDDSDGVDIGYEGMRSFAITKSNVTNSDLEYYLNQKQNYEPGLMKAAYGTFLSVLLVIYENDRVADDSANKFNVTWQRITPICVSLCNDYNCLYITGESDHNMGREIKGVFNNCWRFCHATSFSFSLVEQLTGNNIWNTTKIGSVTLGLLESYLNDEKLEIFVSNGYIFVKKYGDNTSLLVLDFETGILRDYFADYGLLGEMPCYHDNITENVCNYGESLLDVNSGEHLGLERCCNDSSDFSDMVAGIIEFSDNISNFGKDLSNFFDNFDWKNYLIDFGIGVGGSELVSIGAVILMAGLVTFNPALIAGGIIFFAMGEIGIAYSDGLLDGDWTLSDGFFFTFDTVLSVVLPFSGGGIKFASQSSRLIIEKLLVSYQNKIFNKVSIKIVNEVNTWGPIKLIFENLYSDPIKIQIRDFFLYNIVPIPYRERFRNAIDYYWGCIFG